MSTSQIKLKTNGKQPHAEGKATKAIEKVTAGIPSVVFLGLAGGAIAAALTLKLMGRKETANFVGEWVPTILLLGVYNKIVKVLGSDRGDRPRNGDNRQRDRAMAH
jgi:hypothetical protein